MTNTERPQTLQQRELSLTGPGRYLCVTPPERAASERMTRTRPQFALERDEYVYYPGATEVAPEAALELRGRSFAVLAELSIDTREAEGVIFSHSGPLGGHALFVRNGRLHYVYNFLKQLEQRMVASRPVPLGKHLFGIRFRRRSNDAGGFTPIGDAVLYIDDQPVAAIANMKTQPMFCVANEGMCVGLAGRHSISRDCFSRFPFRGGTIKQVNLRLSGASCPDLPSTSTCLPSAASAQLNLRG